METSRAIVSPWYDLATAGALSILAVITVIIVGVPTFQSISLGSLLFFSTLINGAHFTASYRMLYFSKGHARRYPTAAYYVPLFLLAYGAWAIFATLTWENGGVWIIAMLVAASLYLSIHYTGQTFGMISSFAFIERIKLEPRHRTQLKISLRCLMFWQICWALTLVHDLPLPVRQFIPGLMILGHCVGICGAILGLWSFFDLWRHLGGRLPLRVVTPYLAILTWYVILFLHPVALVMVQFFHALQYMGFPLRVELNRTTRAASLTGGSIATHLGMYLAIIGGTAWLIFLFLPWRLEQWDPGYVAYSKVLIAAINIHHFYIDGVIWKISSPWVKEDLFAHLK